MTETFLFADDGTFPNSRWPALVHHTASEGGEIPQGTATAGPALAAHFERLFAAHGWTGGWRASVFPYQHYHSTAHEVLGVYAGGATLLLGGEGGARVEVAPGDVVVIPAGVAHRCLDDRELQVVGAYAAGLVPDLLRGRPGERPDADARIAAVPRPEADPVLGRSGGAATLWG